MLVQTEEPNPSGYVNQARAHQAISNQICSLNGYSATPSTHSVSATSLDAIENGFSKMTLEFVDKIVPVENFVYDPAEDVMALTESNKKAFKAEMDFSGYPVKAKKTGKAAGKAVGKIERARCFKQSAGSGSTESVTSSIDDYKRFCKNVYIKAYVKAFKRAYKRVLWAELNLSADPIHAKKAGQSAGKAAVRAEIARLKLAAACGSGASRPPVFQSKS